MREQAKQNKTAWEHRAYEFWRSEGSPAEKAEYLKRDPMARLKPNQRYFQEIRACRIANLCGSNGRKAVPLALLGAEVTVFDISEENRRYALELAQCAGVSIGYELGDYVEADRRFNDTFDIAYAEGDILHYFSDIDAFMETTCRITKPGGKLVLNDFHPFRKLVTEGDPMFSVPQGDGDYFDSRLHSGDVAYKHLLDGEKGDFPACSVRGYTISEIINAVIRSGFTLLAFHEHPNYYSWLNSKRFSVLNSRRMPRAAYSGVNLAA